MPDTPFGQIIVVVIIKCKVNYETLSRNVSRIVQVQERGNAVPHLFVDISRAFVTVRAVAAYGTFFPK